MIDSWPWIEYKIISITCTQHKRVTLNLKNFVGQNFGGIISAEKELRTNLSILAKKFQTVKIQKLLNRPFQ